MVAADGYWIMRKDSNKSWVYAHLPSYVGNLPDHLPRRNDLFYNVIYIIIYGVPPLSISDDRRYDEDAYKLVKLHDETGKVIPEALRKGMSIAYENKDDGWEHFAIISDISDAGVLTNHSSLIDASQVIGVRIVTALREEDSYVMYPAQQVDIPYLHDAMTNSGTEINTTNDIYLLANFAKNYTSGHALVRMRKDVYYIRKDGGDESVFKKHDEDISALPYDLLFMERGDFIMRKDAFIK